MKALVFQLAETMHCSATELSQRMSVHEMVDWIGYYKRQAARRDQERQRMALDRG